MTWRICCSLPCCGRVIRPCGYRVVCNAVGEKLQCAVLYAMLCHDLMDAVMLRV